MSIQNKKKIIIISQEQFGYLIDIYYYCKYLKNDFNITSICWDFNKEKVTMNGVKSMYVTRKGNFLLRSIRFINIVLKEIETNDTLIFIKYFKGISIASRLLKRKNKFIFDVRSGSVEANPFRRFFYDHLMKLESYFFKNKTVISKSLANKLDFDSNIFILPLGAEIISSTRKKFDKINLLYVGTLYNRKIYDTIIGFSKFYLEKKNKISMQYTIIGVGRSNEENLLRDLVKRKKVTAVVKILGEIPHDNLRLYFDSHNVGISYIPLTDYFDCQPSTKTFEYLLSGMPVIATNTSENATVINNSNGVIIQDTPESFYDGLVNVYKNLKKFDSDHIRNSSKKYSWDKISKEFKKYLYSVYDS
jgi:glycosyltransferase involved in cell wall biosynthesis